MLGILKIEWAQNDGVRDAEDRRVDRDPDRDAGSNDAGKSGVLEDAPPSESEFLREAIHAFARGERRRQPTSSCAYAEMRVEDSLSYGLVCEADGKPSPTRRGLTRKHHLAP